MRSIRVGLAAFVVVLLTSAAAREVPARLPNVHDYPSADRAIWTAEHDALLRQAAAERRADRPDVADVITFLMSRERGTEGLSLAGEAIRRQPARLREIAAALSSVSSSRAVNDPSSGVREGLREQVVAMRARLPELPREEAARVARILVNLDTILEPRNAGNTRLTRLRAFVDEYAGTAEAALAEVDLVAAETNIANRQVQLETYVREHPGTVAGAKALYSVGSALQNAQSNERRNSDPTPRFLEVIDIVGRLESGQFPACEWVERAPSLVTSFFTYQPQYSPENLDRTIDAYTTFISKHFVVDETSPLGNSSGYLITSRMAELFDMKKDAAGIDRTLTTLEATVADTDAVKFLRAVYDFSYRKNKAADSERAALVAASNRVLGSLAATGRGPWLQRALATLATQQFSQKDFANAIASYRKYLTAYPRSDWAWVAAVRLGQSQAALGDYRSARASLRAGAATYPSSPIARVVSSALASEASAALGDFAGEQADLSAALQAWDPDFGPDLRFALARPLMTTQELEVRPAFDRNVLMARRELLRTSLARPGGATIEQARWRVQQLDWNGAIAILEPLARKTGPLMADARVLLHRARLERALAMADLGQATPDEETADRELKALATEPVDFNVAGASIARAALGWRQGLQGDGRLWLREGLEAWRVSQPTIAAPSKGTLDDDVIAIRDVVFRPLGGGLYPLRWNGFEFSGTLPRYLLARSTVQVSFPGGRIEPVAVNRQPPDLRNVLFFDADQEAFLNLLMKRLGGTATRQPGSPMETPNQPIGASMNILKLFNEFFPSRPGHWGGWEFFACPVIWNIEFRDTARTKAAAAVVIGYAGCTVILEKRDGVWVATQLTNMWVT